MEAIKIRINGNPSENILAKLNDLYVQCRAMDCMDETFLVGYMVRFGLGNGLNAKWKLTLNDPIVANRADNWDGMVKWLLTEVFDSVTVISNQQQRVKTFIIHDKETLKAAWKRYKGLVLQYEQSIKLVSQFETNYTIQQSDTSSAFNPDG
eukprot:986475_1